MLFEIADELRRRGGPDALLKMVDMQSPMDIVAQIWDKTDLFVAMLETPDAVIELAATARALQTAFLDEWFRALWRGARGALPRLLRPQRGDDVGG